jgi:hypothetical protein
MRSIAVLALSLPLFVTACNSTRTPESVAQTPNPERRAALLETVTALEGRWVMRSPEGEAFVEFAVTSGGHAVRETMFPGTEHEMINMYTLDGNGLAMTHYCAGGNQPHMRAAALEDGKLAFETTGVSDLNKADEHYMGAMTLVIVDDDHIEQHWKTLNANEPGQDPVFALERVR